MSGLPRPRSTSGSPSRAAAAATRARSEVKYCSGRRSRRSGRARTRARLCGRVLGAAQLDRELEDHVLVHGAVLGDVLDAPVAEPLTDLSDEPLRCRRAGGDTGDVDAVEPRVLDLGHVVDEVCLYAGRVRDL